MCTGSYLPISAALPQTPRTQAVTGPKAPYTIPWKQNFAKILLWLSLMKAIVPEETYSGWFYPRSFTMRGQNGTVKRAWDLETCNPEFESLLNSPDSYYLLRIYSMPGTCFISFNLHNYPMKQLLSFFPIYKEETEAQERWRNLPKVTQLAMGVGEQWLNSNPSSLASENVWTWTSFVLSDPQFFISNINIMIPMLQDWKQNETSEDSQTCSTCTEK